MWTQTGPRRQSARHTAVQRVLLGRPVKLLNGTRRLLRVSNTFAHRTPASVEKLDVHKETIGQETKSQNITTAMQSSRRCRCAHREGCQHQGMQIWQSDPERRDHPHNTEEATLRTANDPPHSPKERSQAEFIGKTCGTEALLEQYGPSTGL